MENGKDDQQPIVATPGQSGAPRGTRKLTARHLLDSIDHVLARPYCDQLAQNYLDAIMAQDRGIIQKYDQLILNKVVSDKIDIGVVNTDEEARSKQAAFMAALALAGGAPSRQLEHDSTVEQLNPWAETVDITINIDDNSQQD